MSVEIVPTDQHLNLRSFLLGFVALFLTQFYFPDFLQGSNSTQGLLIEGKEAAEVNFIIILGYVIGMGFIFGLMVNFPVIKKLILNERLESRPKKVVTPVFNLLNETVFGTYNGIKYNLIKTKKICKYMDNIHDALFFTDNVPESARNRIHNYNSLYYFTAGFILIVSVFVSIYIAVDLIILKKDVIAIKIVPAILILLLFSLTKSHFQDVSLAHEESTIVLDYFNEKETKERVKKYYKSLR